MMSTTGRTSYIKKQTYVVFIIQNLLSCVCGSLSEQYIQTFKEVCPYNNLCNENATKVNTNPYLTPCCEECSCEADCYSFQNCCPDMVTFDVTERLAVVPCVPWYNIYDKTLTVKDPTNIYGYRVISSCPPVNTFYQSTELCEKASRSLDNIVSDSTGRVYRNKDCAICHGVTSFTEWEIRLSMCDGIFFETFDTPEDRDNYLLNNCLAVAVQPEEKVNQCVPKPRRTCEETIDIDSVQLDACHDITNNNIIIHGRTPKTLIAFANANCFLCNNLFNANDNTFHLCDVRHGRFNYYGFLKQLLVYTPTDYQRSVNTHVETENIHCHVTEVYDHITKKCRTLLCPRGSMAEDGQCVNLVKITNMAILFTLPVELTFVKLETLTPEDFIGFATVLEEYVLTTYALSCEICHTTRSFGYVMMRLAVNSTCPMETLRQIAREMSTTLTYLNVTIGGRLITVPVFANLATFEPQLKPYVTGCEEKVYFVAGLAIPVQDCPSVQLSFANMEQAGITKAEFSKLSFSGCIGMKSNDPNMLNISYFRNISDNCPPSHLEMNASRMYTVCIDSYFRLRNSASSLKWSDLLRFSIAVFVIFNMCLFILTCM